MSQPRGPGAPHTPTVPADDERPLRLLERADVSEDHRARLAQVVQVAQAAARDAAEELQSEFGKEHVALIVCCNQFVRLFRAGAQPGAVELLLDAGPKDALAQGGFRLRDPDGMVFKLFGWVRVDPMEGDAKALGDAVRAAFDKARTSGKPSLAKA